MLILSLFAVLIEMGPATEDPSAEPTEPETSDVLDGPIDASSEPTPPPSDPTPPPSEPAPTVVSPSPPAPTPATETKKKLDYEIEGEPGKGLTVKVGKVFSLNVKSRIQIRYQINIPPEDGDGNRTTRQVVNIGTARLWFSGHVITPKLKYMIQLAVAGRDYRDGATSPLYDAYLDWAIHRDFGVKAGQYFVPFDRLRTVRESALQMADRPRPVGELTLDRDVGVTIYSEHFLHDKSPVAYRIGAFGGGGMNLAAAKSPGGLFVGRLEVRPLGEIDDDEEGDLKRRKRPALALGGAFAANIKTDRQKSTTGITFQGGTTNYYHAASDLVFKWRGWAVQGEYLRRWASDYSLVSTDPDGMTVTEYTRSGQGWVAQTSYVFDPPIEIVARLSGMYTLGPTDPAFEADMRNRGQEVAGGLNYYFNGHRMKLQADWIGLMPHDFDFRRAEHIVHVQLDVTF
jgi:hypothetical protein